MSLNPMLLHAGAVPTYLPLTSLLISPTRGWSHTPLRSGLPFARRGTACAAAGVDATHKIAANAAPPTIELHKLTLIFGNLLSECDPGEFGAAIPAHRSYTLPFSVSSLP